MTLENRFSKKWILEPNSGCWLWIGAMGVSKYGQIRVKNADGFWAMGYAHRVSWRIYNSIIPDKMHVLHKCDNPSCVNPSHLFLGTQKSNMEDKALKGRQIRGEQSTQAKITEKNAISILNDTRPHKKIANQYNISASLISRIKTRRAWRHVC